MTTAKNSVTELNPRIGFCRDKEAAKILSVSRTTWWQWVSQKKLNGIDVPQPVRLSKSITAWKRSEIIDFCEQLSARHDSSTPPEAA